MKKPFAERARQDLPNGLPSGIVTPPDVETFLDVEVFPDVKR